MRHGAHLCPQLKSEFVSVVSVEGKERNGGESKVKDAGVKRVEGEIIQSRQQ